MAHKQPRTQNMSKKERAGLPHYDEKGNVKPGVRKRDRNMKNKGRK